MKVVLSVVEDDGIRLYFTISIRGVVEAHFCLKRKDAIAFKDIFQRGLGPGDSLRIEGFPDERSSHKTQRVGTRTS